MKDALCKVTVAVTLLLAIGVSYAARPGDVPPGPPSGR